MPPFSYKEDPKIRIREAGFLPSLGGLAGFSRRVSRLNFDILRTRLNIEETRVPPIMKEDVFRKPFSNLKIGVAGIEK